MLNSALIRVRPMAARQPEEKGEPVDPFDVARGGSVARRRWLGAMAAAAVFLVSLLVPSAGRAAPDARQRPGAGALSVANSPGSSPGWRPAPPG